VSKEKTFGYMGQILRVDLSNKKFWKEELDEVVYREYVGGNSLGAKYLLEEVPAGVEWSSPENRLILMTGPLSGTRVSGTGSFCALTKGPMTNMATASQTTQPIPPLSPPAMRPWQALLICLTKLPGGKIE